MGMRVQKYCPKGCPFRKIRDLVTANTAKLADTQKSQNCHQKSCPLISCLPLTWLKF